MTNGTRAETCGAEWTIRPFRPEDAEYLSRIYQDAVRTLAARYYAPDQIAAWLSIAPAPERLKHLYGDGRSALVCAAGGRPIAFSDHDAAGHIRFLYCDPAFAGRHAASCLLNTVEMSARCQGLGRLTSEASEAALPVFRRHGFRVTARRSFELGGVTIHNYAVEKRLTANSEIS